jgi:hypothetical protein
MTRKTKFIAGAAVTLYVGAEVVQRIKAPDDTKRDTLPAFAVGVMSSTSDTAP